MEERMGNAKKLLADLQAKLRFREDARTSTMKGVKNLSVSDLEILELYAQTILKNGYYRSILMNPVGGVKEVLEKYSLYETSEVY